MHLAGVLGSPALALAPRATSIGDFPMRGIRERGKHVAIGFGL